MFAQPDAPTAHRDDDAPKFKYDTHIGSLLLVDPTEAKTEFATDFGPKDVIAATVAVVDGPDAGAVFVDALLFGVVIFSQLKGQVGNRVLGRLAQGTKAAGQKPPWILEPATATDIAKAEAYVASLTKGPSFATPATAQAPF